MRLIVCENYDEISKKAAEFVKAQILLLVSGKEKHEALCGLLSGKVSTKNPSSVLNMHKNAVIICDKEAENG